jgi:hypothetical protein
MHGNNKFNVLKFAYDLANRSANGLQSAALVLATMRRQQNTAKTTIARDIGLSPFKCKPQSIDPSIPCKKYARGINAFSM